MTEKSGKNYPKFSFEMEDSIFCFFLDPSSKQLVKERRKKKDGFIY